MAKTRKQIDLIVRISVPVGLSAADARREVRTLINEQSNWGSWVEHHKDEGRMIEIDDIKVKSIKPAPKR